MPDLAPPPDAPSEMETQHGEALTSHPSVQETEVEGMAGSRELDLTAGDRLGRYVALERLGAGGMGVVWACYDPELDRRVAVKLLHTRAENERKREVARTRLVREAQAMAKVSHPNVITVHDVGTYEGHVFVAMEYLSGGSLGAWLDGRDADARSDWAATVEIFRAAGAGLAAAHAAGLVHRDFKPENVILRADGRPTVVDFGLVRATDGSVSDVYGSEASGGTTRPGSSGESGDTSGQRNALSTSVTHVGAVMGTPAYMSPEQHLGHEADARSDQFSFCVALFEALYGVAPFQAPTLIALARRVLDGDREPVPEGSPVPAAIRDALLRGLARDPADRWPSMEPLLEAFDPTPAPARFARWPWLAGGAVALALGAWALGASRGGAEPEALCMGGEARAREVWGEGARARASAAFEASGLSYAEQSLEMAGARLDRWREAWGAATFEACAATRERGEQSVELMDRRMACLDRQLGVVSSHVELLTRADERTVERAVDLVDDLPDPERCSRSALIDEGPLDGLPPTARREAEAAIARSDTQLETRHYEDAERAAQAAMEATEAEAMQPLRADALHQLASVQTGRGDYERARANFEAAAWTGLAAGRDGRAAASMLMAMSLTGDELAKDDDWQIWASALRAVMSRLEREGDPKFERRQVMFHNAVGGIHERHARYEEALAAYAKGLELVGGREAAFGALPMHLYNNVGIVHTTLGNYPEAVEVLSRAVDGYRARYGSAHPDVGVALENYGAALERSGDYAGALEAHAEAITILEAALPPTHPELASAYDNYGATLDAAGQPELAVDYIAKALATREAADSERKARPGASPDEDPEIGVSANNLGDSLLRLGRWEEAKPHIERACAAFEVAFGADHPHTGACLNNLAQIRAHEGRDDEAFGLLDRALKIHGDAFGADHPYLAYHRLERGRLHLRRGEVRAAITDLGEALRIRDGGSTGPSEVAEACEALAEALEGRDPKRRRMLLERARDNYRAAGAGMAEDLERVLERLSAMD